MVDITKTDQVRNRPLSPHIQVYEWRYNMTTSILHRATGIALSIGTLLVVALLLSAAMGEESYGQVMGFLSSPIGKFMLFGWSAAIFFHICSGMRHLFMDAGRLMELRESRISAVIAWVLAAAAVAAYWFTLGK